MTTPTMHRAIEGAARFAHHASELMEFLALPGDYFNLHGGQHWYQVISRSEIESALDMDMRMIALYELRIVHEKQHLKREQHRHALFSLCLSDARRPIGMYWKKPTPYEVDRRDRAIEQAIGWASR